MKPEKILKLATCFLLAAALNFTVLPPLFSAGDYTWRGGEARRSALGGVSVSLPDASSMIDLYEEGFASSLVLRKKMNVISTTWLAIPHEYTEETPGSSASLRDHPLALAGEGDGSAGITYFFDNDSVMQFKPYVMLNEGEKSLEQDLPPDSMSVDSLENLYAADVIFSRRITENFSGGASLRASFYRDEAVTGRDAYIDYDTETVNITDKILYSKAEFSISGTYSPDENVHAAVSFGTLKSLSPYYEPWITGMRNTGFTGAIRAYPVLFGGYGSNRFIRKKTVASLWESSAETEEKQGIAGYDINAACGARGQDGSVFTASAGLTLGITGNYSVMSSTVVDMYPSTGTPYSGGEEYKNIRNGLAHHFIFKGRYDFGAATAAGMFSYHSAGADFSGNTGPAVSLSSQVFDAVIGASFSPDKFIIPVEIFMETLIQSEKGGPDNRQANYALFTAGLRGGAEYEVSEGILMRLGFDAAYGGPSSHVKNDSGVNDAMLGTYSNPAYMQAAISLGAGHYNKNTEINLNLRYSNTQRLPYDKSLLNYDEASMTIMADVKVYL
jgi:hypothetical protein